MRRHQQQRNNKLIGLSVAGEAVGPIFLFQFQKDGHGNVIPFDVGSVEANAAWLEIHNLSIMLKSLLWGGVGNGVCIVRLEGQRSSAKAVWDMVLGAFPCFRSRWQDDTFHSNGMPRASSQMYPSHWPNVLEEMASLEFWRHLGVTLVRDDKHGCYFTNLMITTHGEEIAEHAHVPVASAVSARMKALVSYAKKCRVSEILSLHYEVSGAGCNEALGLGCVSNVIKTVDRGIHFSLAGEGGSLAKVDDFLRTELSLDIRPKPGYRDGRRVVVGIKELSGRAAELGRAAIVPTVGSSY